MEDQEYHPDPKAAGTIHSNDTELDQMVQKVEIEDEVADTLAEALKEESPFEDDRSAGC